MWTVARMSKERKRKSSGSKTAWVFSYEPFANEPRNIMMMMKKKRELR